MNSRPDRHRPPIEELTFRHPQPKMSVLDLMVLVLATSVAAWVGRMGLVPWCTVFFSIDSQSWANHPVWLSWHWGSLLLRHTQPLVAAMTLAAFALRLRRPNFRRLVRQPGFAACSSASLALLVGGGLNYATTQRTFVPGAEACGYTLVVLMPHGSEPGLAVAASWLLLGLGRRWQAEPSWIDRLGRIAGIYWIVMIPIAQLAPQH